jgi:hypothetical protein
MTADEVFELFGRVEIRIERPLLLSKSVPETLDRSKLLCVDVGGTDRERLK